MNRVQLDNYTRNEIEAVLGRLNMTLIGFLKELQRQGFLLHGSLNCNIKKFIPKVPGDLRGGWGTQKGVYATSTTQPIFFSLIHRDLIKGSTYFEVSRLASGKVVYAVCEDIIKSRAIKTGCIYIFDRKGFTANPNGSAEWVSLNPVVPLGKIPTEVSDLNSKIRVVEVPEQDTDWSNYTPKYIN